MQRELREVISNSKKIILYGNGVIAHLLYGIFEEKNQEKLIGAFAVSKKNESERSFNNVPVILISDVKKLYANCEIVIAVEKQSVINQMIENLNSYGIERYILLSEATIKKCHQYQKKKRRSKIIGQLGYFSGCIYRLAYFLHKRIYIGFVGKKVFKVKTVLGNTLSLRLFSRDLDFYESIFVGDWSIIDNWNVGEYDISLKECDTVFDFGANIGLFTLKFAPKISNINFVAVEPEEGNFTLLKNNTSHFTNVVCVLGGVWYRNAFCKVFPGRTIVYPSNTPSEGGFYIGECDKGTEGAIEAYSIEYFINKYKSNKYVIKMDIEGAEKEIFEKGDLEWLNNCVQLIIETHARHVNDEKLSQKIITIMEQFGFTHYNQGENIIFEK